MLKFKKSLLSLTVSISLLSSLSNAIAVDNTNQSNADKRDVGNNYISKNACKIEKQKDKSSSDVGKNVVGSEGDWLVEGTDTYKVAKQIFDYGTKEKGVSGAMMAGILGNVMNESAGYPDRAESNGSVAGIIRFGMDSDKIPKGGGFSLPDDPRYVADPHFFGGGLWQTTPYTNYTNSKFWRKDGKVGWDVGNQVQFLWADEFENRAMQAYFNNDANYGFSTGFSKIEDWYSTNDPEKAALAFMMYYLRPSYDASINHYDRRVADAKKANAVFNKDNIKADKSKWVFTSNGVNVINLSSSGKKAKSKSKEMEECEKELKSSGGVAEWGEDGTGSWDASKGTIWRKDELPKELEKYAIKPENVGLTWGNPKGWSYPSTGCFCNHLASSWISAVWVKKGTDDAFPALQNGTTGWDEANRMAQLGGGKVSYDAKKGSLVAVPIGTPIDTSGARDTLGHVYVVSHVFENGDYLLIEQNVEGYSGDAIGGCHQWNYRYVTKEHYKKHKFQFYYPGDFGYEPNKKVLKMTSGKK